MGSFDTLSRREVFHAIASLEPSNIADAEVPWMVENIAWKRVLYMKSYYYGFFTTVLTYFASTEQSKRSQVPLTAAVIHAMHTVESGRFLRRPRFVESWQTVRDHRIPIDRVRE